MLKAILGILIIFPLHTFAQSSEERNVRIREIKEWVSVTGKDHTCADEYLKRRKQLSIRMALAPLSITAGVAAGLFAGGTIGHAAYLANPTNLDGWADLSYTLGGAAIGVLAGAGVTITTTTISTVNFFNNQRLLKAIFEAQNESGKAIRILHQKYTQTYPEDALSIQDFSRNLAELDLTGKLCDASIVAPSRRKKGRKLKQNLATKKEIFTYIHSELTK